MAEISTSPSKVTTAHIATKETNDFRTYTYYDKANIYTLSRSRKKEPIINRNVHIFKRTKSIHT